METIKQDSQLFTSGYGGISSNINEIDNHSQKVLQLDLESRVPLSNTKIAKELHIDRGRVGEIRKSPEYKQQLANYRRNIVDSIMSGEIEAVIKIKELLDHPDPYISLRACALLSQGAFEFRKQLIQNDVQCELLIRQKESNIDQFANNPKLEEIKGLILRHITEGIQNDRKE